MVARYPLRKVKRSKSACISEIALGLKNFKLNLDQMEFLELDIPAPVR